VIGALAEPEARATEPQGSAVGLGVTYYTDPLCCWSWAFEPVWLRLRRACVGRLAWRVRMGGMIRRWDQYDDPLNAIHRPGQMGPLWLQAERETGVRMDTRVWAEDPPQSSWPACLAFKAAELQSPLAGEAYLKRMRRALFADSRNIARREVLAGIAAECQAACPSRFDAARWESDFGAPEAQRAFRADMGEARMLGIGRFPTLVLSGRAGRRLLTGWRPYEALAGELLALAPELGDALRPDAAPAADPGG
jgi:predicted DsbA family dithiol-disulfide isomerase